MEPAYFECYRCGQAGHYSSNCPARTAEAHPPASPAEGRTPESGSKPAWMPPPVAPRVPGVDPTADYLTAKAALGYPADGHLARLLSVKCPWCDAGKGIWCMNRGTGRRKDQAHEARYAAALVPLPPGIPGADTAVEHTSEARAARSVLP